MKNKELHYIKRFYIAVIYFVFFCLATNNACGQKIGFIEYKNDNKISMNFDGTIIKDKPFTIEIPNGLKNRSSEVGSSFLQVFNYHGSEKIIILYIPGRKVTPASQLLNLSYNEFVKFCENEDIDWCVEDIKIKKHERFGIYKPTNDRFYAIYLNVKSTQVELFNQSITTLHY